MIRFQTPSGKIVTPGGDPKVKKGMVPTPPLKAGPLDRSEPYAPISGPHARIAELEAEVARLKAALKAANAAANAPANTVTPVSTPANAKTKTDRKAYQRDLMRKRRAAAKRHLTR